MESCVPAHGFDLAKSHKWEIAAWQKRLEWEREKIDSLRCRIKGARDSLGERLREKLFRLDELVIEFDLYATGESFELFFSIVERCREALK